MPVTSPGDTPPTLRYDRLASLLPVFEDPGFSFGAWAGGGRGEDGAIRMPFFAPSDAARQFLDVVEQDGWMLRGFDRVAWIRTEEGQRLKEDPGAVTDAGAAELARLLTAIIRADRFSDGALAGACERGLLTAILRRIDRLHRAAAG